MFKIFQVNSWSLLKVVQILLIFDAAYPIFPVTVCGEIWQTMSGCGSVCGGLLVDSAVCGEHDGGCMSGRRQICEDVAGLYFG